MANLISVRLNRGDSHSWGFRLQGGKDFGTPLVIQKISGGSPAERAGLIAGDTVVRINNVDVYNLRHKDAQDVILRAGPSFDIAVHRGGSTWKPSVAPVGSVPPPRVVAPVSNVSPVTATSLAAGRQDSIGAIGTTHNVSAKPFSAGQVNGGPRLVNKQYNSPLPLYSEQSIAETLSAQTEVLSNGVLGVNFKKNEKSYDSANSAVFRMVQEADKEPRDYEAVTRSDFYATHSHAVGGHTSNRRSVSTSEHSQSIDLQGTGSFQPEPEQRSSNAANQQMTKCTDCERVIVGVFVRIKDKNLHVECFKCATCGTSLKNVGYYNLNNKLYCDVHAKLAARNNPPSANLQPITVPPGGKIPAGAISAALSSHSLPSPAPLSPLSPNTNYSAAPYQPGGASFSSPRPFSSVNAPLSPPSSYPKLSSTSPTPTALAESRGVQNIVWPPIQNEPELPTASPLYFPPPSQVQLIKKEPVKVFEQEDREYSELEEMSYLTQESGRNMSMCSTEVSSITGRRSAIECTETISDTIDAQILVDSIMQARPKSLEPRPKTTTPADVNVTFTISEAQLKQGSYVDSLAKSSKHEAAQVTESKSCSLKETKQSQCLASMYEKKIKVENTVPQKWESPMLVALTVASDKPYTQSQSEMIGSEYQEIAVDESFSQIPTKKSSSALASALATAPSEPFTPVTAASLEPVPLPEETVPYFPPECRIVIEHKVPKETTETVDAPQASSDTPRKTKKQKSDDELFKDLPKPPAEKISMLSALTTAPERPYSPFNVDAVTYQSEAIENEDTKTPATNMSLKQTSQKSKSMLSEASKSQSLSRNVTQTSSVSQKPYSSFSNRTMAYQKETTKKDHSESAKSSSSELVKRKQESKQTLDIHALDKSTSQSVSKNIRSTEDITKMSSGMPPFIQSLRSSFETKTDKVQMEMTCQFDPITQQQIITKSSSKMDVEEQTRQKSLSERTAMSQSTHKAIEESQSKSKSSADLKATSTAAKKVVVSSVPIYETTTENLSESALLQQATCQAENIMQTKEVRAESKETAASYQKSSVDRTRSTTQQTLQIPPKERITVIQPGQTSLSVPEIAFQPVSEDLTASTTFSPRPRPITPSMINKPAPVIPAYQANLVAVQCAPTEINVFEPTSPAPSRSPSPYPGRPASPFPSSLGKRAVSPAPGPPPNPLQSNKSAAQLMHESKIQQARSQVQSYIPQHQTKLQYSNAANYQAQKASDASQHSVAVSSSHQQHGLDAKSVSHCSTKQQQQQLQQTSNQQSERIECCRDSSVQIQRKKTVSEEYEHTKKSKVVQSEKYSSGMQFHSSETTNAAVLENQAVVGFHLTNPQPLKSPFISSSGESTNKSLAATVTQSSQKDAETNLNMNPAAPSAIPKLIKPPPSSGSCTISSNVNVKKPSTSQPNTGSGGGRQAGAIGVAPKRGRGILNLSATPGSRVPLCGQCHSNIRGPFITALGKIWCPDHFICATPSCRRALHDLGFVEEHGQLYCEYCFEQYLAPPCSKCSSKVKGDCLKAIGKTFHPECFNCVYCGKLFGNSPFFLEDGQPYCEADWNELFTTKCFACGFPVEAGDRWVEALNNNYHSQCFNCTMCKKNLEGQSFFAKGGRPFCKNHAR